MSTPTEITAPRTGQAAHTPTPWRVEVTQASVWVGTPKGERKLHDVIFGLPYEPNLADEARERNLANADFIVRACNSHEELVAALEGMLRTPFQPIGEQTEAFGQARAALAKAKGGQS